MTDFPLRPQSKEQLASDKRMRASSETWSMQEPDLKNTARETDDVALRLEDFAAPERVVVVKHGPNLLVDLQNLASSRRSFDVLIIEARESGFLFSAQEMIEAASIAKPILEVQGALVFVKQDKAAAFVKESYSGALSFQLFESFSQVYDYSTTIAKYIQQAMGESIDISRESTNLSEQILLSAIPVLTSFGIKLKAGIESASKRNLLLCAIDNYTPLNSIIQRLSSQMSFNEILDELRQLEKSSVIYPIFPKIPFLVQNFRGGMQFRLKDYLLEARLLSREQLDEVISAVQTSKSGQRLSLGAMSVAKGYISARQLEIALQDQAFYGQTRESEKTKFRLEAEQEMQSLIGNLRTTDAAGVLQNLASNRASGVLVVEYKDLIFKAVFEQGKLSLAKQNKLKGNPAVTEFVSTWTDGVFVFLERSAPADLSSEECKVTRQLDKLLLDSALASDNIESVWKKLPSASKSVIEKVADQQGLLQQGRVLNDPQEGYELNENEIEHMRRVWSACDGLSTVSDIIKAQGDLTTAQVTAALARLFYYRLVRLPNVDLATPLARFRTLISLIAEKIGIDRTEALLRISLRESMGYSAVARVFTLGTGCEIGADLSAAKASSLQLSKVVKALEDWQFKYLDHVSQELDKNLLHRLVSSVYQQKT